MFSAFSHGGLILSCAGVDGIWKRIASFNITAGDDCPSPWVKSSHNGVSFCIPASTAAGCYSVNYSTNGMSYHAEGVWKSHWILERNRHNADAFGAIGNSIDSTYVEGLFITHGSHTILINYKFWDEGDFWNPRNPSKTALKIDYQYSTIC